MNPIYQNVTYAGFIIESQLERWKYDEGKIMILHFDFVLKISCLFVSKAHGNHGKASSKIKRAEFAIMNQLNPK
jgi:hypothetical protein